MNKDKNITTSINHVHVYQYIISGQALTVKTGQTTITSIIAIKANRKQTTTKDTLMMIQIYVDNLIELTSSGEHDASLKYINIPDDSSNHYTLNTNRTSAEKKTDGTQQ